MKDYLRIECHPPALDLTKLNAIAEDRPWKSLTRPLLVDGKACDKPVGATVDCFHYVNGETISKTEWGFRWESRSVWCQQVVQNFCADFDEAGHLVGGTVNCFGLGVMPIDGDFVAAYSADSLCRSDWMVG